MDPTTAKPTELRPVSDRSLTGLFPSEMGVDGGWTKPGRLHRLGRRIFWTRPALYRWVALGRKRALPKPEKGLFWVGGYPRSANTFTAYALQRCIRPGERVSFHLHLPPQILRLHAAANPGIFVIREPLSSAISWCQYFQLKRKGVSPVETLSWALDYYIDFHDALGSVAPRLFIATFDDCTRDICAVLEHFFASVQRFHIVPPMDPEELKKALEHHWTIRGAVNEMEVGRPSALREEGRAVYRRQELLEHPEIEKRLADAAALHRYFLDCRTKPPEQSLTAR